MIGYADAVVIAAAAGVGRRELLETQMLDLCADVMRACPSAPCLLLTRSPASKGRPRAPLAPGTRACGASPALRGSSSRHPRATSSPALTSGGRLRLGASSRARWHLAGSGGGHPRRCFDRTASGSRPRGARRRPPPGGYLARRMLGGVSPALGELTARWLAGSKAARSLVSWSCVAPRLGPSRVRPSSLCSVHCAMAAHVDVAWLAAASQCHLAPLGGAWLMGDAPVHRASERGGRARVQALRRHFEDKLLLAWHAHAATGAHPLHALAAHSPVTALLGAAGRQCDGSAGSGLESMAAWRRSCGCRGRAFSGAPGGRRAPRIMRALARRSGHAAEAFSHRRTGTPRSLSLSLVCAGRPGGARRKRPVSADVCARCGSRAWCTVLGRGDCAAGSSLLAATPCGRWPCGRWPGGRWACARWPVRGEGCAAAVRVVAGARARAAGRRRRGRRGRAADGRGAQLDDGRRAAQRAAARGGPRAAEHARVRPPDGAAARDGARPAACGTGRRRRAAAPPAAGAPGPRARGDADRAAGRRRRGRRGRAADGRGAPTR